MLNLKLTDYDIIGGEKKYIETATRFGARGILYTEDKIALMNMTALGWYKLPGGGVENNENFEETFIREIKEETGCTCKILKYIGTTEEHKLQNDFLQISHVFTAEKVGETETPSFTKSEKSEGFLLEWKTLDEAIKLMELSIKKCDDYSKKFVLTRDFKILEYIKNERL